jgi:hypothetical protein
MASDNKPSRIRFRSPLLQPPVEVKKEDHYKRIACRWPLLTVVGIIVLIALFFIWVQPFGRYGLGRTLYWLHDTIYLPIKGYTFTLYHPESWIWWGLAFTLLALWTVSFALDRSFILRWHIALLTKAVHQPILAQFLLATAHFFARHRIHSRLLVSMVERERQLALHQLRGKASTTQCRKAANLTRLLVALYLLNEPEVLDHARAAVCWHETFLQLVIQAKKHNVDTAGAQKQLGGTLASIVSPLSHHLNNDVATAKITKPLGFDLGGLFIELVSLVRDGQDNSYPELPTIEMWSTPDAWLVEAVDQRRVALMEARKSLELQNQLTDPISSEYSLFNLTSENPKLIWLIGQLAMSLAMHITLRVEKLEIGLAYLEAIEAMKLTLKWRGSSDNLFVCKWAAVSGTLLPSCPIQKDPPPILSGVTVLDRSVLYVKQLFHKLVVLIPCLRINLPTPFSQKNDTSLIETIYELPRVEHYQFIAWLSHEKQARLRSESKNNNLLAGEKPLIRSNDLALGDERSLRLQRTAGMTNSGTGHSPLLRDFDPNQVPKAAFDHESINLPLRRRIDAVLVTVCTAAFSLLLFSWFLIVQSADRAHFFESPVVGLLKDDRILFNVRDDLPESPFLDAVLHSDSRIYISQAGGLIHRYDPATGLWDYEQPDLGDGLSNNNFVLLRSGCGDDPRAEEARTCPEPDVLWAVTEGGGLVRRDGRSWELVVGDTAFMGATGRLMTSQDLTTAAISDDGEWLVVGTQQDGFGVYNLHSHQWLMLSEEVATGLPSLSITRMVWWQDRFWLAGPRGLISLSMRGRQPVLADAPAVHGEILDLDVGLDGDLWTLAHVACETDGDTCLWLGKLTHPDQPSQTIISQRNNYPGLNLADLTFAQYQDNNLTVAGAAGIYLYDTVPHSWQRLFAPAVGATLPIAENNGFFFAYREGIGLVQQEEISTWEMPERGIVKLLYDNSDVLALTQQGNVFALTGNPRTITEVFIGSQTGFEPEQFVNAAGNSNHILLIGSDGALLHNAGTRSYEDISSQLVPDWLRHASTQFLNAGAYIYALTPLVDDRFSIRTLPVGGFFTTDYFTSGDVQEVQARSTSAGVVEVWPWNQGLGVLQINGIVDRFTPQSRVREVGPALADFHNPDIVDVTNLNDNLIIASPSSLVTYDRANRVLEETASYTNLRAIEAFDNTLLLLTTQGQLLRHDHREHNLIGATEGFTINDANLSDGLLEQQNLYLAGGGRVERYDTALRRVGERWNLPGEADVRLLGIVEGKPVALTSGRATWGDAELPGDGSVIALSLDDNYIWTVREESNSRYLMGHSRQNLLSPNEARCFFRNQSAEAINQIQDARALPEGPVVVATDTGLRFYDPADRSWFLGPENVLPTGGRLYLLGEYLAAVSSDQDRLWLVRTNNVQMPGSCATSRVAFQDVTDVTTRAVTINEETGQMAWITPEEAVVHWQNGQSTEELPPVSQGPNTDEIWRVYQRSNHLFFTTDSTLWQYDLSRRQWQQIDLQFNTDAPNIAAINIESYSGGETVVVQGHDGSFYLGPFTSSSTTVSLSRIFRPQTDTFDATPLSLLDVQQRSEALWTFVLDNQLRYYNPQQRQWEQTVPLGDADSTLSFETVFDRGILVGRNGRTWQVARSLETEPVNFSLFELRTNETTYLDDTATIWRWQPDGSVWQCPLPAGPSYDCSQTHSSFWLESDKVRRVFAWRNLLLFETDSGFLGYNTIAEEAAVLPDDIANWPPGSVIRQYGQQLWLYDQNTVLVLQQTGNGQLAVEQFADVLQLVFDKSDRPWARFGDQWQYWDDERFVTPTNVANIFAWEKTTVTALGDEGHPYRWDDRFIQDDFVLPPEIDRNRITGLWHSGEQEWWVLAGTQLHHVTEGICQPQSLAPFTTQTPTPIPTMTPTSPPSPTLPPTWTPAATPTITATLTPTATPTPTPTPTPTTTPTPIPIPCYVVAGQINITPHLGVVATILQADATNSGLILVMEDRRNLQVQRQGTSYQVQIQQNVDWHPSSLAEDRWPLLNSNVATLPNNREAYNPITSLTTNTAGELIAVRPGTSLKLADQASNQFSQPPPLNVTWLQWNRTSRDFSVQTPTGIVNMPRHEIIVDGQLIFEEVTAVLAETPDSLYLANEHGLWLHRSSDLWLDDPGIIYQPLALGRSIEAAHGRFLISAGDLFPGDMTVQSPQASRTVQVGDITLMESVRNKQVNAAGISGAPIFVDRGFIWDRDRRGLAFSNTSLLLQSDAGIHPINSLTNFDAGPNQLGRQAGLLHFETGQGIFLQNNNTWYKWDSGNWNLHAVNPTISRILLTNNSWEWRLANGDFRVSLAGAAHDFDYPQPENNFSFSTDRLLAAAVHQGQFYIVSEAFLEIANNSNHISNFSASRLAPLAADSLESFRFIDGSVALYRYTEDTVSRWNEATQQFTTIDADPRQKRDLVQSERLQLTYDRQQPIVVTKKIKVEHIQRGEYWIAFDFERGLFPFDIVTTMAVHQGRLYIGSRAGLQVYTSLPSGLNDIVHLYDLRQSPALTTLMPVEIVGVPQSSPDLIMARSNSSCVQSSGNTFTFCLDASLLDWRVRANTPLWQWIGGPANQVTGNYYDFRGRLIPDQISIENGRFPHDKLQAVSVCNGRAFSLWQNGWITVSGNDSLHIQTDNQIFPMLGDRSLRRFICLERAISLPQTTIPNGLYLEGGNEETTSIWRFEQNQWQSLQSEVQRDGVLEHADFPPVWEHSRLRLLFPEEERPFVFQQKDLGHTWHDLPWEQGRIAIDHWHQLIAIDNTLWAATPAGLVSFERNHAGLAELNLSEFLIIREPGEPCQITDLQEQEGEVWVRCQASSNQVYRGQLNAISDRNIFNLMFSDPFVEQTLIDAEETGYWEFLLTGYALGSPGSLRNWLHGEEIQLVGGQFAFDTINSLAFLSDSVIDVGTAEGGWFQIKPNDWHIREWQRPSAFDISPQQVIHVSTARAGTEMALCLRQRNGDYLRVSPGEDVASVISCPELLADNGLWRYQQEDGKLLVTAIESIGGVAHREVISGRFTDDIVIGPPAAGRDNGETFYLFPTQAGVVRHDSGERSSILYTAPFPSLTEPPSSLLILGRETPVYIGTDALYALDSSRDLYLPLNIVIDAVPHSAGYTVNDLLSIRWHNRHHFGWNLIDPATGDSLQTNLLPVNISQYGKYVANYVRWDNLDPWMNIILDSNSVSFSTISRPPYEEPLPGSFDFLVPILYNDRLILIGRQELLSINLEYGLIRVMSP